MNNLQKPYLSRRWDDELYHHGIKGQKWGVRHDKQPLGNRRHSIASSAKERFKKTKLVKKWNEQSEDTKNAIKAGVAIGVGAGAMHQISNAVNRYTANNVIKMVARTALNRVKDMTPQDLTYHAANLRKALPG
jgi:hypothetical protein